MDEKSAGKAKILKEFGANLNRLIRDRYRSRDEFLKQTDLEIYKADLHHMIKGSRDPQLSTLYKIAEALKVSVCELIPKD